MSEAYIIDAIRTPRGKGKKDGSLYEVKPITLLTTLLNELKDRHQLEEPSRVGPPDHLCPAGAKVRRWIYPCISLQPSRHEAELVDLRQKNMP